MSILYDVLAGLKPVWRCLTTQAFRLGLQKQTSCEKGGVFVELKSDVALHAITQAFRLGVTKANFLRKGWCFVELKSELALHAITPAFRLGVTSTILFPGFSPKKGTILINELN